MYYPSVITPGLWLFTLLIEVPCIAILANCGRTDDGQRAMTKAHVTFERMTVNELKLEPVICYLAL